MSDLSTSINKYPRTQHVEGSGLQRGDEDLGVAPFAALAGRHLVIEEKMDGANCAVSFGTGGELLLQSRGHYLTGGPRERQFAPLKGWAACHGGELWGALRDRYVMYGEWLYAKHTIFYTELPHYFMEFDVLDTVEGTFLSTGRRRELLAGCPFVAPVHVLHEGEVGSLAELRALAGPSRFIAADPAERLAVLRAACAERTLDSERALRETDTSGLMEGLYIKVEEGGEVRGRYKYVRGGFLQTVIDSESHWMDRPLLPNRLRPGVSLF